MSLAMYVLQSERHLIENFKLVTVAKYLDIEVDDQKVHGALYDIELAREVYRRII